MKEEAIVLGVAVLFALRWWLRIIIAILKALAKGVRIFMILMLFIFLYFEPKLMGSFLRGIWLAVLSFFDALFS